MTVEPWPDDNPIGRLTLHQRLAFLAAMAAKHGNKWVSIPTPDLVAILALAPEPAE